MLKAQVKRTFKAMEQQRIHQAIAARALSGQSRAFTDGVNCAPSLTADDVALLRIKDGSYFANTLVGQEELIPAFSKWARAVTDRRLKLLDAKLTLETLKKDFEAHRESVLIRSWYGTFNCCMDDYKLREFAASAAKKAGLYIARKGLTEQVAAELLYKLIDMGLGLDGVNTVEGVLNRLKDEYWWRAKLRRLQDTRLEQLQRNLHCVGGSSAMYLSDVTFRKREIRTFNNQQTLENLYAVAETDDGESWVNLAEAAKGSQSNPVNRAAFMAVRIKGLKELAQYEGMASAFITITTPSRYHSVLSTGAPNPNYIQGSTASKANQWLKLIYSRIRADWQRMDLNPFGVRVVEMHHDGCPHWHILLFAPPEHMHQIKDIMQAHALIDGGHELKNPSVRFDWRDIDPQKGDAVGYVIKYVAKGVNSSHLEDVRDNTHNVTSEDDNHIATLKMKYALSAAGIQQFQFFGIPAATATVWQELRRLGQGEEGMRNIDAHCYRLGLSDLERFALTALYKAADAGDWAAYCQAMGGIYVKRTEAALRILYSTAETLTALEEQVILNRYGEEAKAKVRGLLMPMWRGVYLTTRHYHYRVVGKDEYQKSEQFTMDQTLARMDMWERAEYFEQLTEQAWQKYDAMVDEKASAEYGVIVMEPNVYTNIDQFCAAVEDGEPCALLARATEAPDLDTLDLCQ